jgi:hypothetical protein
MCGVDARTPGVRSIFRSAGARTPLVVAGMSGARAGTPRPRPRELLTGGAAAPHAQ